MGTLVDSGKRDRLITIEQISPVSQDSSGAPIETWVTFATRWANVKSLTTRERFASDATHGIRTASFFISPYLTGLNNTMRISYDGAYWEIRAISEVGRRVGQEVLAEAIL